MNQTTWSIEPPERGMAAITHLSGLESVRSSA
jgi:hypothetical protein